jgi:hypothetical protein
MYRYGNCRDIGSDLTIKSCTLESHVFGHDPVVFRDTSVVIVRSHLVPGFFYFVTLKL